MTRLLNNLFFLRHDRDLKQCLVRAETLARSYSHDYVGVEHVFLSLRDLALDHPVAAILAKLPLDVPAFWEDLEREAKVVTGRPVPNSLPRTPRLVFILKTARNVAERTGKREVGLYHFVSAVALEHTSLVAQVFYRQLRIKGPAMSFPEASAQMIALIISFPEIVAFNSTGHENPRIAPKYRTGPSQT